MQYRNRAVNKGFLVVIIRGPANNFELQAAKSVYKASERIHAGKPMDDGTSEVKLTLLDPTLNIAGGHRQVFKVEGSENLVFKVPRTDWKKFNNIATEAITMHVVGNELIGDVKGIDVDDLTLAKFTGFAGSTYIKVPGEEIMVVVQEFADQEDLQYGESGALFELLTEKGVHTDCAKPRNSGVVYSSGEREVVNIDNQDVQIWSIENWRATFDVSSILDKIKLDNFDF